MIDNDTSTTPVESPLTSTSDAAPSMPSSSDGLATVGAEVDAMFGYRAPSLVRDEPDDVEAGAPPAPSSETKSTTDQPIAGAPPVDPAQSTTTEAPIADDPMAGATSLTYTVNGQERADERIKVVKDLGAFIDPKDVPYIQQRLSERDHLHEKSQESFQKYHTLETLTQWPKRDAENNVVGTLTGRDAIEAARIDYGNALAKIETYEALLNDPARLATMLRYVEGQGYVHDEDQVARLLMQIENRQLKLTPAIRQHLASLGVAASPTTSAPAATAAPSVPAATAVDMAVKHAQLTLTPVDKTWAESHVTRYMRTATQEDVRQTPTLTLGEPILDPQFIDLLRDRVQIRAESAKQATAAADAAKANAPKLAAALAGRTAPRPAAPTRQPAPTADDELSPEEHAYLSRERASAQAIRARSA